MKKSRNIIAFIALSMAAGFIFFAPCLKYSFYDQMLAAYGIDDVQINMCYSVYAFICLICYPVSGWLGDKVSVKILVPLALFADAAVCVVYSFASGYGMLLVIHGLLGFIASGIFWCPYLKAIRLLGDEQTQGKMFGISEAVRGLASALIGFCAVFVLGKAAGAEIGMRNVNWMAAVFLAALAVIIMLVFPKEAAPVSTAEENSEAGEKVRYLDVIRHKGTWLSIFIIITGFCIWLLANSFLSTYTVRVLGISTGLASTLGVIRSYVLICFAGFGGGWLMDKVDYKGKGFLGCFILCIISIAGIMLTSNLIVICIGLTLLLTLLVCIIRSTYWSILGEAGIPVKMTGSATGIISFVAYIPESFITVICGKWISKAEAAGHIASGFNQIFLLMIGIGVLGCVASILLMNQTKRLEREGKAIK